MGPAGFDGPGGTVVSWAVNCVGQSWSSPTAVGAEGEEVGPGEAEGTVVKV